MYRNGNVNGAIRVFDALVHDGATSLSGDLDRWRREAELRGRMLVAVGSGVTVEFEGPEDEVLAKRALASVERAAARIGNAMLYYPTTPIVVVLYTSEQFRDITRSPSWAAGAFDGTIHIPIRGALGDAAELDRVLAHEYTHALIRDIAGTRVPAWLNEGLAAALEDERPAAMPRPEIVLPLEPLAISFHRLTGLEAKHAYATSAFAVRRLLEAGGAYPITNLLRDVGDGLAFNTAFAHRMLMDLREFEAGLHQQ